MGTFTICDNPEELAVQAADAVIAIARESLAARGRFVFALCGGSTPEKTYRLLGQIERAAEIDWPNVFVFFGDERFVPLTDPRSNYRMAYEALLAQVPIPASQVFPVQTAQSSAAKAAEAYEAELVRIFAAWSADSHLAGKKGPVGNSLPEEPRFDLILLGLGEDGHTASLFPGSAALDAGDTWVTWSTSGSLPPPVDRISFTYRLLNAARNVMFLVSGVKKAAILRAVIEGNTKYEIYPAAGVCPHEGRLMWYVDRSAAERLTPEILEKAR